MKCEFARAKYNVRRYSVGNTFCTCLIENKALATLFFTSFTWYFHVKFASISISKNLVDCSSQSFAIMSKIVWFICILNLVKSPVLCFGRRTIYLVFLAFKDYLFEQNHSNNCLICLFELSNSILISLSEIYDVVSSACCWSLTSLCHSNGHIETMPAQEINPFTALTRIRSQFLRTQWSTNNHQRVDTTTPQTAQPSGLAVVSSANDRIFPWQELPISLTYMR